MKRSASRFFIFFVVAVLAGAALIWLLPTAVGAEATVQAWIPPVLGAVFAASAFIAWKVRPDVTQAPSTRP